MSRANDASTKNEASTLGGWSMGDAKEDFEVDYCYDALTREITYEHVGQRLCIHVSFI